jgi:hypothetical protein
LKGDNSSTLETIARGWWGRGWIAPYRMFVQFEKVNFPQHYPQQMSDGREIAPYVLIFILKVYSFI